MRRSAVLRPALFLALTLALALAVAGVEAGPSAAEPAPAPAAEPFTVTAYHFKVKVGPDRATTCNIVGDLYRPRSAGPRNRVPAVLTTNGFGGSKADQAGMASMLARRGYAVLSYSGLGFGGSGCKITLDDRLHDGAAARQLVSYLGGKKGIAFHDAAHTRPAPQLRIVQRDQRDHRGRRSSHDPRVGMTGGSYGGQVQFAAAGVDPRIDAIAPQITWNDLSYALAPNNTGQDGVSTTVPGAVKLVWGLGFAGLGMVGGLSNAPADPGRMLPCPNFPDFICPALVQGAVNGYFEPDSVKALRRASVASYVDKVRIPTLLLQGQNDTLFNLNEAIATFRSLRQQGTPVKMVWKWGGHSGGPAAGEEGPDRPHRNYVTKRILNWFEHHLKGRTAVSTGPRFAWFRDWVNYAGDASPAYASSPSFPAGIRTTFRLTGPKRQILTTPVAGLPTSIDHLDTIGSMVPLPLPEVDLPGTYAAWNGSALNAPVDVVGTPRVRLKIDSIGSPVLFVKLLDVARDGKAQVVRNLVAPVRVVDPSKPFTVTMPAVVHRFAKGHRMRLVVAGGSTNYRGNLLPTVVSVKAPDGQALSLPVTR